MKKTKTTKNSSKSKVKPALFYGDYADLDDDKLREVHGRMIDVLEEKLKTSIMKQVLYNLMECERELTLRENV